MKEIRLDPVTLSEELLNGEYCQCAFRGERNEIESLLKAENFTAEIKDISQEISQFHLLCEEIVASKIDILKLISSYPLLKVSGFIETTNNNVFVFYSESGCKGVSEYKFAGNYEAQSEGGSGRWAETENVCEPIQTRYKDMHSGGYVYVDYQFPYANKWNRYDFATEDMGIFFIDADTNLTYRNGEYVKIDEAISDDFQIENGILLKYTGVDLEVSVPNTVKEIAASAFSGNRMVQHIQIAEGCLKIGCNAFAWCENLREIELPNSLREIGKSAFICTKINQLYLPKALEKLEFDEIYGLSAHKEIVVPDSCAGFSYCDDVLLDKKKTTAYFCKKSIQGKYTMPETVSKIAPGLFEKSTLLEEVILSPAVQSMPRSVFHGCSSLKTVVLPSGLSSIGEYAFFECKSLEEIHIPETVKSLPPCSFERTSGRIYISGTEMKFSGSSFSCSSACIIAPNLPLKSIPSDLKRAAAKGICAAYIEQMPIPEETISDYVKYLKRQKKALLMFVAKDKNLFDFMVQFKLFLPEDYEALKKQYNLLPELLPLIEENLSDMDKAKS